MKTQFKKTAGLSMGVVIIFVTLMSVMALAMVMSATMAFRNAQRIPVADGTFFSAEAAMNTALSGIAIELVSLGTDNELNVMRSVAQNRMSAGLITNTVAEGLPSSLPSASIISHLMAPGSAFPDAVRNQARSLIATNIALPPMPASAGVLPVRDALSPGYFWFIEGNDVNTPRGDFAEPAFANLRRDGSGVYVGFTEANLNAWLQMTPIDTVVDGPNVSGATTTTTTTRTWRIHVEVSPYIVAISYAGEVELSNRLELPFEPFYIDFETVQVVTVTQPPGTPDTPGTPGTPGNSGGGATGNFFHTDPNWANADPNNPVNAAWSNSQMGYPNVTVNGGAPGGSVPMPQMSGDCPIHGAGFNTFMSGIRSQARGESPGSSSHSITVPAGATVMRREDGRISTNGGTTWTEIPAGRDGLRITGNYPGVTLVGDFTGLNVYVTNNVTLNLGSATQPFIALNTPGNERAVASSGNVLVNVVDGHATDNVFINSYNGTFRFENPGAANAERRVHMGATFIANNFWNWSGPDNEIRATQWGFPELATADRPIPIPQFISHQAVKLNFTAVNGPFDMGAFIMSASGDSIQVTVNNGTSNNRGNFHGMFVGQQNAGINRLQGVANLIQPPLMPRTEHMLPRFSSWAGISGGSNGGTTTPGTPGTPGTPPPAPTTVTNTTTGNFLSGSAISGTNLGDEIGVIRQ